MLLRFRDFLASDAGAEDFFETFVFFGADVEEVGLAIVLDGEGRVQEQRSKNQTDFGIFDAKPINESARAPLLPKPRFTMPITAPKSQNPHLLPQDLKTVSRAELFDLDHTAERTAASESEVHEDIKLLQDILTRSIQYTIEDRPKKRRRISSDNTNEATEQGYTFVTREPQCVDDCEPSGLSADASIQSSDLSRQVPSPC